MCLYPLKLRNKKYTGTKKNRGIIPSPPITGYNDLGIPIYDNRVLYIEVPCGQCIECRKTKAREWQVRLAEELKTCEYPYFVTLTFAPKELEELCKKTQLKECNAIAGYAVRHMLERYRKDKKHSLRHWLITELGHEGTERIHLHGLIFSTEKLEFGDMANNQLRTWKYWKYGHIYVGEYTNERTINYISKYITKIDNDHKGFIGQILASPGIGRAYTDRMAEMCRTPTYKPKNTVDYYRLETGVKVKLPKYYKNKIFSEDEKELIWRDFMDKKQETIAGNTFGPSAPEKVRKNVLNKGREVNEFLGYGDDSKEWQKREYNITRRMLQQIERKRQMDIMQAALEAKVKAEIALKDEEI